MTLFHTDRFASAAASGTDWRDAARQVLEQLAPLIDAAADKAPLYTLGFLYITEALAPDAGSLLALLRSVTRISHWVGMAAMGVCGTGASYVETPALAVLIGRLPAEDFCLSPVRGMDTEAADAAFDAWLDVHDPMLVLAHGTALPELDTGALLAAIERRTGGFVAGGLSSARRPVQIADEVEDEEGFSGVAFSQNVAVSTALTQGCAPMGLLHTVTRCEDNTLIELDGQRAFDVFAADLKVLADKNPDTILREQAGGEVRAVFRGEVHVAFPVTGSDQRDYMVRSALGIDANKGWITVAQDMRGGDRMMFVHRDTDTARADLSRMLIDLRSRVSREQGGFAPAGALYISCVSRARAAFGDDPGSELRLIRDVIGDVPLAGFYAAGEISNARLYGYTGVLILFL